MGWNHQAGEISAGYATLTTSLGASRTRKCPLEAKLFAISE